MNLQEIVDTAPKGRDIFSNTLELIRAFQVFYRGNSPSLREIAAMIDLQEGKPLGTTGANTAENRVSALETKGLLVRPVSELTGRRDSPRIILRDMELRKNEDGTSACFKVHQSESG